MTKDQCLALLEDYEQLLKERGAEPVETDHNIVSPDKETIFNNSLFMVLKMKEFIQKDKMDKFYRWLGFLQCVLWVAGEFSMNQLREHNRHEE